jgi:nucleoid-associated protein YgaU
MSAALDVQLELLVRSPTSEQIGAAVQLLEWAFWLGWMFVVATTLLRIIVVLATRIADGAAWVRSLRWLSDLLTLPFIRRAVDSSMAGAILLRVAFVAPSAPVAYAAPITAQVSPVEDPTAPPAAAAASSQVATPDQAPADMQPGDVLHVVRYGETLISISRTYFGDEDHWKQIYADNRHRPQPHHGSLDDAGKIYKDWVLIIHRPSQMVEYDADGTAWHTVRQGETLWGIYAAVYGDGEGWPDLFAANEGLEYRGYVLTNPNVIHPGMRLRLVGLEVQPAAPAARDEPEQTPAPQQEPDSVVVAPDPTPPVVEPSSTPAVEQAPSVAAPTVSMPTAEPVATATEVPIEEQSSPPPASSAIPTPPAASRAASWDNIPAWAPEAAGAAAGVALIGLRAGGCSTRPPASMAVGRDRYPGCWGLRAGNRR